MKKLIIALAVMLMASQAMAVAYVDWFCASGFFTHDSTDAEVFTSGDDYPYGNIGVGQSVLWALMYTTVDSYGTASTVSTVGNLSTVELSDTIAASRYFAAPGWADMSSEVGLNGVNYDPGLFALPSGDSTGLNSTFAADSGYTGGYFYQAVFANVSFNAGVITFTDSSIYYTFTGRDGNDGINPLAEPTPTPQDLPSGSEYAGVRVDSVLNAVPEPATMSLLGLGALVMAIRRRRS